MVVDRNRITGTGTGTGVTAGLDLRITALLRDDGYARVMQLLSEYDPQPPFDAGSPEKAPHGRGRRPGKADGRLSGKWHRVSLCRMPAVRSHPSQTEPSERFGDGVLGLDASLVLLPSTSGNVPVVTPTSKGPAVTNVHAFDGTAGSGHSTCIRSFLARCETLIPIRVFA